ncbi:MAG: ABC transporter permease [Dehalococcoidia bacterium]|nr:ABC transporter permease [Dehalococcoidia bacterium]
MAQTSTVAQQGALAPRASMLMPMPRLRMAWAVWMRGWNAFSRNYHIESGGIILEPLILLGAIGFGLGQFVGDIDGGTDYATFVAPGVVAGYAMFHALFDSTFGFYMRMDSRRVIRHILETPVQLQDLALGEAAFQATRAAMASGAVLAMSAIFGLVDSPWALLVVPTGFLVGLIFAGIGLCFAAIVPSISSIGLVFNIFASPMFYFSGVFFPLESLPDGLQPFVWALPLTPSVYLVRGMMSGDLGPEHGAAAAGLIAGAVVSLWLAYLLLRRRLIT